VSHNDDNQRGRLISFKKYYYSTIYCYHIPELNLGHDVTRYHIYTTKANNATFHAMFSRIPGLEVNSDRLLIVM
jgi:hypothetical protein